MPAKISPKTGRKRTSKKVSKDVPSTENLSAPLFDDSGSQNGTVELPAEIFGLPANENLVHRLLLMQLGNRRQASAAHTKEKGEVRGGGRKPFRQKGTGRARQGSTRNPHMKGGGVAFGPRNTRNFKTKLNKQERRKALFTCLSAKARAQTVLALESYDKQEPKTKDLNLLLKKMPLKKDVLIVIPAHHAVLERSARNLPYAKTLLVQYLNPDDLLKYGHVLFLKDSLTQLSKTFGRK